MSHQRTYSSGRNYRKRRVANEMPSYAHCSECKENIWFRYVSEIISKGWKYTVKNNIIWHCPYHAKQLELTKILDPDTTDNS